MMHEKLKLHLNRELASLKLAFEEVKQLIEKDKTGVKIKEEESMKVIMGLLDTFDKIALHIHLFVYCYETEINPLVIENLAHVVDILKLLCKIIKKNMKDILSEEKRLKEGESLSLGYIRHIKGARIELLQWFQSTIGMINYIPIDEENE